MVQSAFSPTVAVVSSNVAVAEPAAATGSIMSATRTSEKQAFTPLVARTRWRKTPTTFGPMGRLICTFLLVAPLPPFIAIAYFTGGFEVGGPLIWGFIVMPLGLKDVWKAGTIPLN
jgi:hypothetical protein